MVPTYRDGDLVCVNVDAYLTQLPSPDDVVLALHPFKGGVHMIKRVSHLTDDGRFFLVGDNPRESSDSRGFGPLRLERILGKVIGITL
jgi:phage repressor protein C with HTH and peptisase S24 domain